ncbi:cryptochrome/photolyase family protein [Methanosarcina sp. Mfa9]|uniref:cryptochrome/photolyase family protein n=1 Tax=Methanosarcina sp. Mfa9 TaxID=3439063 RepID=UPI003F848949
MAFERCEEMNGEETFAGQGKGVHSYDRLALVPGNCLFPSTERLKPDEKTLFFMAEDPGLCTRYAFHKHKLVFVLSAMRSYRDWLAEKYDVLYYPLPGIKEPGSGENFKESENPVTSENFIPSANPGKRKLAHAVVGSLQKAKNLTYETKLKDVLEKYGIGKIVTYTLEDSFFRESILNFCARNGVELEMVDSPGFLTPVETFRAYKGERKKLRFNDFYIWQRKRLGVLLTEDGLPVGGKWNLDRENRKPLPRRLEVPKLQAAPRTGNTEEVIALVDTLFPDHPGRTENFYLPTTRKAALAWLDTFLKERFRYFGPYEDALAEGEPFLFHSVLSPLLNFGLLTPGEVVEKAIETYERSTAADEIFRKVGKEEEEEEEEDRGKEREEEKGGEEGKVRKVGKEEEKLKESEKEYFPFSSLEGFVRQVIGWREFMRGMHRCSEIEGNFFGHERKLDGRWYRGDLGIEPVDRTIRQVLEYGYAHHIQRLMVLGNFMLLCEIHPAEVYRWFMELFVDSADWVMVPNVYGMSQFADGGSFATKPYISGSNYLLKMGDYEKGEWCEVWDALFWSFIDKNREFFLKNYRTAVLVGTWDKMSGEKRKKLLQVAARFLDKIS